ncbi:MAG: GNAT family N-acetyltransferase [Solirubrobacterales bacterium]|nr:GNAT family N-acetyltransferase [Solirubrobacterales bacterium]
MTADDLERVRAWMGEPHIARWWLAGSTVEEEIGDLERCVAGDEPTHALIAIENGREIGWCQWYSYADYPEHGAAVGAERDEIGIDYAVGDPARIGRGVGTALIAALVLHVRQRHPRAGLIADPEAANSASRRALEKNGFVLQDERVVATERTEHPMAIYRLAASSVLAA